MASQSNDIIATHYRAINSEGRIITEGDDAEEVLAMSRGEQADILIQQERRVVSNWTKISKDELSRLRKIYNQ